MVENQRIVVFKDYLLGKRDKHWISLLSFWSLGAVAVVLDAIVEHDYAIGICLDLEFWQPDIAYLVAHALEILHCYVALDLKEPIKTPN